MDTQVLSQIPSEQDLKALPLRALVAFTARCVRRVQPVFLLPSSFPDRRQHSNAVADAIALAEEFARGEPISSRKAHEVGTKASHTAEAVQQLRFAIQQALVAKAAAEAAYSVHAAALDLADSSGIVINAYTLATKEGQPIDKAFAATRGLHTANFAARSSALVGNACPALAIHISRDFTKLKELALGAYPELGQPIDPAGAGPLGPLWLGDAPKWYSVDGSHPFFDEVLQFNVSAISLQALLVSSIIRKASGDVAGNADPERITGQLPLVEVPDLRLEMSLLEENCPDRCVVNTESTVDYVMGATSRPAQLIFALWPSGGDFPDVSAIKDKLETHIGQSLETIVCYLIGGAFERYNEHFKTKFGKDQSTWPPEVQFFRHLRNACFHGNTFNMWRWRGSDQIDPANPPKWHIYTMPEDRAMNGKKAINGFFRIPHVLPLLHDMGKFV